MPNASVITGNDSANVLDGTNVRDVIYGFDPDGPQSTNVTSIAATRIATGLDQPLFMTSPPGDLQRLFIVEKTGAIKIMDLATRQILPDKFLDVSSEVVADGERGLLGLAFDPQFQSNGYFYVNLINKVTQDTEIRRYQVSADNPNLAEASTSTVIITVDQPPRTVNHKAGWLGFGPDGNLYVNLGDGGGSGDPSNNGQNANSLLGKILRLDVRSDDFPSDPLRNYTTPSDNPFVGVSGADEIYALGLRNPWRASFDRGLGDFYIGDVGQSTWEEIDIGIAGANYGWDHFEGPDVFAGDTSIGPGTMTAPIHYYPRTIGHSVVGGYVYRGTSEGLQGQYFFADFNLDKIFTLRFNGTEWVRTDWTPHVDENVGRILNPASLGEDGAGNLYVVDFLDGELYTLVPVVNSADQDDTLRGRGGDDMMFGGSGNDMLIGGIGADWMTGGRGNDIYYVDNDNDFVIEMAGGGNDMVVAEADYVLPGGSEVEVLRAKSIAPGLLLTGNEFDNRVYGAGGDDILRGAAGNDTICGLGGADMMIGNNGDDRYFVDDAHDQAIEAVGQGADSVFTSVDYALAPGSEIEYLRAQGNGLVGLVLTGNEHDNRIFGGAGNDTLRGGGGRDTLTANGGDDRFVFDPDFGNDTILGFLAGAGSDDKIMFDSALFADFTAVMAAARQAGGNTVIVYDADDRLTLSGVGKSALHSDDFGFF